VSLYIVFTKSGRILFLIITELAEIKVSYSTKNQDKIKVSSPKQIYELALKHWDLHTIELQEVAKMILLNRNNSVLGIYEISKGGIAGTILDLKIVLSVTLKCNASSIILLHNHPSGNLNPSESDKKITRRIKNACELLDLKLLEHLIISKSGYFSFVEDGLL